MKQSKLLEMVFEPSRWTQAIDKAELKNISKTKLRLICSPEVRLNWYYRIINGQYEVSVFHISEIPKDDGGIREVWIAEDEDRVFLSIVNDCLMELFRNTLISDRCKSYLSGIGCQEIVQNVSKEVQILNSITRKEERNKDLIMKLDLRKYFDTVTIEVINSVFDLIENMLGFENRTEPIINVLRKLYNRNLVFNKNGELVELYGSLMQGCATAGFLADVVLYDVDEMLAEECRYYVRYSDDMFILNDDIDKAKAILDRELPKYGVALHPKKCERHTIDSWVKFLGFNIKGNIITLSKSRVKKLTKEIYNRTLAKPYISPTDAKRSVNQFLYGNGDGYSWATACFSAMQNNEKDIEVLNNFIMDCLRLCEVRYEYNRKRKQQGLKPRRIKYGWDDIGGIGVVTNLPDRTLLRGKGNKVKTSKERTQKEIDHYKTMGCLLKCYKISRPIYETVIRGL